MFVFFVLAGSGAVSGDAQPMAITSTTGTLIGGLILLISLPSVIAGIGLLTRKSWSRILTIVVGCLGLLNIPIGTALGIYAIWAMTRPETQQILTQ